jgi:hypothetical protein
LEGKRPKDEDNNEGEEEEEKKSPRDERVKVPMKP